MGPGKGHGVPTGAGHRASVRGCVLAREGLRPLRQRLGSRARRAFPCENCGGPRTRPFGMSKMEEQLFLAHWTHSALMLITVVEKRRLRLSNGHEHQPLLEKNSLCNSKPRIKLQERMEKVHKKQKIFLSTGRFVQIMLFVIDSLSSSSDAHPLYWCVLSRGVRPTNKSNSWSNPLPLFLWD